MTPVVDRLLGCWRVYPWRIALLALTGFTFLSAITADAAMLSASDRANYRKAFEAAAKGDWATAQLYARRGQNRLPGKVLTWRGMTSRDNPYRFEQIAQFIADNPDWPRQRSLQYGAERAIDDSTGPSDIIAFFADRRPRTADGMIALGEALEAEGRVKEGHAWLRRAWKDGQFVRRDEELFLRRHGRLITTKMHEARLETLLWQGRLWEARRMLRRVPADRRAVASARIALRSMSAGVDAAINRIPKALRKDPGLMYERLRWRRRMGRDDDALEIIRAAPPDLGRPDLWARERIILARRLLVDGRITDAWKVIRDHGVPPTDRVDFLEAEWLSGWIALRWMNEAAEAETRFERVYDAVRYPVSRSRAAYWAGRAADALGKPDAARQWFLRAAAFGATYHGQLAAAALPENIRPVWPSEPPPPTSAEVERFNARELVRVVYVLDELGRNKLIRPFVRKLGRMDGRPSYKHLVAHLALAIDRPDLAVWVARDAQREGTPLYRLGYPMPPMPEGRPERALLLALARQESNFDHRAVSRAGARGIMQLMPATARTVARTIRVRYSSARLTADPAYNVRLGRAYLNQMLDRFDDSYILAVAAYNGGPNAVQRWIQKFGDPREAAADPIDWIEMIPYEETRTYVQRVLGNLQVYRSRIKPGQVAATLDFDLQR